MDNFDTDLMERRLLAFGCAAGSLNKCWFDRDNGQVPALKHARNYVSNWESCRTDNIGLLFWGPPGTGKTYGAACIANALMEFPGPFTPTVIMATFGTILRQLLAQSPQEKDTYIRKLLDCDLLILDDLGMERQTEYAREQVFNIVDGRCLARKPMVVTTNLTIQQLRNPKNLEDQRIFDRVLGACVPVCFQGQSQRSNLAAEKMRRFLTLTGNSDPALETIRDP